MNSRILQLLQQPQQILTEDLPLLAREIQRHPYAQSLRALQLLGTSRYAPENYQTELSTTAAYTTDKKVLYELVHGRKFQPETEPEVLAEEQPAEDDFLEEPTVQPEDVSAFPRTPSEQESPEPRKVTPLDEVQTTDNQVIEAFSQEADAKLPSIETVLAETDEDQTVFPDVSSEENLADEEAPASYERQKVEIILEKDQSTAEILVEDATVNLYQPAEGHAVTIPPSENPEKFSPPKDSAADKVEQARRDLIAEVERRMAEKRRKPEEKKVAESSEAEEPSSHQINFSPEDLETAVAEDFLSETPSGGTETPPESFAAQISEDPTAPLSEKPEEDSHHQQTENLPVEDSEISVPQTLETTPGNGGEPESSNVPGFFSTWMSWLKLDRPQNAPAPAPKKIDEDKLNVIDKFIATEPKITPVRGEDSSGKSNDKKDNIMHLMTDTLANLYVEQRLYGKALQAYEHLSQKYPEKGEFYAERIAKIQEMRTPGGS